MFRLLSKLKILPKGVIDPALERKVSWLGNKVALLEMNDRDENDPRVVRVDDYYISFAAPPFSHLERRYSVRHRMSQETKLVPISAVSAYRKIVAMEDERLEDRRV